MGDQWPAPGWWRASDGNWYPPEEHPIHHPPPYESSPSTSPKPPTSVSTSRKGRGKLLTGVVLVGAGIALLLGRTLTGDAPGSAANGSPVTVNSLVGGGPLDGRSDIYSCEFVDGGSVQLFVTNSTDVQSNYMVDVEVLDQAGQQVGDETFFVNHVRPGEGVTENVPVFDTVGGVSCVVAEVLRSPAASPADPANLNCEVTGVGAAGKIVTVVTASNPTASQATFDVAATLSRAGVRVGSVSVVIGDAGPGQTTATNVESGTDGPADGVICEVLYLDLKITG